MSSLRRLPLLAALMFLLGLHCSMAVGAKEVPFRLLLKYQVACDTACTRFRCIIQLPMSVDGLQQITSCRFSPTPDSVYTLDGNSYAHYTIDRPNPSEELQVKLTGLLHKTDYTAMRRKRVPSQDVSAYLQAEKWIESDSVEIREWAASLKGGSVKKTVDNIFTFVSKCGTYAYSTSAQGALEMLRRRKGDCTEYSDLFVALCRACGIPARVASGVNSLGHYSITHSWAEVYMEPHGWVMFDPTPGNKATFQRAVCPYVRFTTMRFNPHLGGGYFYRYAWRGPSDGVKMKMEYVFELIW